MYLVIKSIEWSRPDRAKIAKRDQRKPGLGVNVRFFPHTYKYNAQIYAKEETHIKLQLNGILTLIVASIVMLESPGHVISVGITGQWGDGQAFSLLVH